MKKWTFERVATMVFESTVVLATFATMVAIATILTLAFFG